LLLICKERQFIIENLVKLYGQGRAIGSGAETAAEMREMLGNEPIVYTIDKIDHLVS